MDENKHRRRWLNFGIRDLLWAMVVVGLGVGWWQDHRESRKVVKSALYTFQHDKWWRGVDILNEWLYGKQ